MDKEINQQQKHTCDHIYKKPIQKIPMILPLT